MAGAGALLEVDDVTFRYSKRSPELFGGLTFACDPATMTVIEGENGSGKSTLLRLCAGIRHPSSGTITRHGRSAFLPQSTASLNPQLTGNEHILLFGAALKLSSAEARRLAAESLEQLHFTNADLGISTAKLSGGSRQKLSLALTLMDRSARLILLDEPYAGFDTTSFTAFIDLLSRLKHDGSAVMMVNHIADPRLPVDQEVTVTRPTGVARVA